MTEPDTKSTTASTNFREAILRLDAAERAIIEAEKEKAEALAAFREARYRLTVSVPCPDCRSEIGKPCNWGNPDFHWYLTHTERQINAGVNEAPK